ncbi:MAG: DNA cytosine methyltransferase [Burkholderiales bacterium]|nr:DNA cytosine methyltransferase [Burkholderiales bacterium]
MPLLGLDAWDLATKTYKANFPKADIVTDRIENVDIAKLGKIYRPDVLLTSPECTSHSIARGAKPGTERSRETAIGIVPWVESMHPRWLIVENVNRMKKWDRHNELVESIENLGYTVSDLLLNSADFGSAQARKRMFLVCDRDGTTTTREHLLAYVKKGPASANSVIEWRAAYKATPLYKEGRAKATLDRAERAITELGRGVPFLIVYYGSDYAGGWQRLDAPLRTVTTIDRFGLVTLVRDVPLLRMLQPTELLHAMCGETEHKLPFGSRREQVKLCGNGVCSEVMAAIFRRIKAEQQKTSKRTAKEGVEAECLV